jgi:hypothetical protein
MSKRCQGLLDNSKGDMSMKRQYENNGKTFWEDIDATMRRTAEQYKEAINKNSGGEGWICLSLR